MKAFTRETSTVVTIPGVNCDTDQIIPVGSSRQTARRDTASFFSTTFAGRRPANSTRPFP